MRIREDKNEVGKTTVSMKEDEEEKEEYEKEKERGRRGG